VFLVFLDLFDLILVLLSEKAAAEALQQRVVHHIQSELLAVGDLLRRLLAQLLRLVNARLQLLLPVLLI